MLSSTKEDEEKKKKEKKVKHDDIGLTGPPSQAGQFAGACAWGKV